MHLDGPTSATPSLCPSVGFGGASSNGALVRTVRHQNHSQAEQSLVKHGFQIQRCTVSLCFSLNGEQNCGSYVQIFRNGCLEYGDGYILNVGNERGRPRAIPSKAFEQKLVETFSNGVSTLKRLGIEDPIYFSCTLVGVKNCALSRDGIAFYGDEVQHRFDRQVIQSPDLEIDRNEPAPYRNTLLPVVDSIWQANGYQETPWLRDWGLDGNRRPVSSE